MAHAGSNDEKYGGRKSRWTVPLKHPAYLWDFLFIVLRLSFCLGHIFEKIVWTILKKVNMETVKASTKTLI